MNGDFADFLKPFDEYATLRDRVRAVLERLPVPVVEDFLQDNCFHLTLDNFVPGQGWSLWMAMPAANRSGSRADSIAK